MKTVQNFYKETITIDCTAVVGKIYVSNLPTPTDGWLVISPNDASKREIIEYSGTGTDTSGNYVTSITRGVGGTNAQAHSAGEYIRMNITAEYWADMSSDIQDVATDLSTAIIAGASPASTTSMGITRTSYSPDATIGTATITIASPGVVTFASHGLTANDMVKFTTTGTLPTGIVAGTTYFVSATGLTTNTFSISATLGGTRINTTGSQSGVHTLYKATPVALSDTDPRVVSTAEKARIPSSTTSDALAGGGSFGTPSSTNKFITQSYNSSSTGLPVVNILTANSLSGDSTTRFDITNIAGTTFRYTYDGTGTDPSINSGTFPIGTVVDIQGQNFASGNNGLFVTTGVGANYFEITNASGVAENDKTLGIGYLLKGSTYTKPSNLKYVIVEVQGAGCDGSSVTASSLNTAGCGSGGGAGGYAKKLIAASSLGSTESYVVGARNTGTGKTSARSVFGLTSSIIGNGGSNITGGAASGGNINVSGQDGGSALSVSSTIQTRVGAGGNSYLGLGGAAVAAQIDTGVNGFSGTGYGSGGSGGSAWRGSYGTVSGSGGDGANGVIIITEYYS